MYDFFELVNTALSAKGFEWIENLVQPAAISTMTSDMATEALARFSQLLVVNGYHNGHPDLIPKGEYPGDAIAAGDHGIEVKSAKNKRVTDCHSPRNGWYCQFVYVVDDNPIRAERQPTRVKAVHLANVREEMFRLNDRGRRGTRTATLNREGVKYLYQHPVYLDDTIEIGPSLAPRASRRKKG